MYSATENTKIVEGTKKDYNFIYEAQNLSLGNSQYDLIGSKEEFMKLKDQMLAEQLYLNPVYQDEYPQAPYKNLWELFEAAIQENPDAKNFMLSMTPWDSYLKDDGEEKQYDENGNEIEPLHHYYEFCPVSENEIDEYLQFETITENDPEWSEYDEANCDYDSNTTKFIKEITIADFLQMSENFDWKCFN